MCGSSPQSFSSDFIPGDPWIFFDLVSYKSNKTPGTKLGVIQLEKFLDHYLSDARARRHKSKSYK